MEKKKTIPETTIRILEDPCVCPTPLFLQRYAYRLRLEEILKDIPHVRMEDAMSERCMTVTAFPQHIDKILNLLRQHEIGRIVLISE